MEVKGHPAHITGETDTYWFKDLQSERFAEIGRFRFSTVEGKMPRHQAGVMSHFQALYLKTAITIQGDMFKNVI